MQRSERRLFAELRDEDVGRPRAHERGGAELQRAREVTRDDDVAGSVDGDARANLLARVPEALVPNEAATRVELRHEDVRASQTRERRAAAEVHLPREAAAQQSSATSSSRTSSLLR